MKLSSIVAAAAIVLGTVAAAGAAGAAPSTGSFGGGPARTYIGHYVTYEACAADGNSPKTGGTQWECVQADGGWDLYTF